jgi:hypothetical protein
MSMEPFDEVKASAWLHRASGIVRLTPPDLPNRGKAFGWEPLWDGIAFSFALRRILAVGGPLTPNAPLRPRT